MFTSANVSNLEEGKNGVSNNNLLHLNTAQCFAVLKALPMYTSAQLITQTTLGGGWDVYYVIAQQFVAPSLSFCLVSHHFTHALSEPWSAPFSLPCPIFSCR